MRPDPFDQISTRAGEYTLTRLWGEAQRVEAVLTEANQLLNTLRTLASAAPKMVEVVTTTRCGFPLPATWNWRVVPRLSGPEFLLFYTDVHTFPDSALLFSGTAAEGWISFHSRPIVLHRLRQRFRELLAARHPHEPALAVVREDRPKSAESRATPRPKALADPERVRPAELYGRILAAHFCDFEPGIPARRRPGPAPHLAPHQQRAFERACRIIDRFNGVVVADAVGLGKTYIGLRLIERTLERGGRVLVVVPASLRQQWESELLYLRELQDTPARPASSDRPARQNVDLWLRESRFGGLTLISTERLGRRSFDASAYADADLVLVDEAHHFRNPLTRRYRVLSDLTRYSEIVLLTATPINNTLLDLQHLIALFAAPGAFRHLGIPDYRETFRRAAMGDGDVGPIISACVLRRTRRFLREHYGQIWLHDRERSADVELRFPRRAPPQAVTYDLAGTYGELFARLDGWLDRLRFPAVPGDEAARLASVSGQRADPESRLARPAPARRGERCIGDATIGGSAELLKIILLKRLESSLEAFRRTVIQQLAWCDTARRALDAGRVLTRPDYRASFRGPSDDPGSQLALFELMLPTPDIDPTGLARLRLQLQEDHETLTLVHRGLAAITPQSDLKLQKLIELLDGPLEGGKVLVFTEFRDTARYLHHQLADRPFIAQIDSSVARLGLERASRRDVIHRFAPRSNNLPEPPRRERVDLLIATDVLSEGLNLQDASAVVSYDLPWNPVRLMQRIGRIDRLGALSEVVALYHFVPGDDLERLLGIMQRLDAKLITIGKTLGLDHPVIASSESGQHDLHRVRRLAADPLELERLEAELEDPLDPEEQAYLDFVALQPEEPADPPTRPAVAVVTCRDVDSPRAVAYWRVALGGAERPLWLLLDIARGFVWEDEAAAVQLLRASPDGATLSASDRLVDSARRAFARHAARTLNLLRANHLAGESLSPGLPQCRIAAWLSRHFQRTAHRLAPELRAAIDQALDGLARRFTPASERALARLAEALPENLDREFLDRLLTTLLDLHDSSEGPMALQEIATLLVIPQA